MTRSITTTDVGDLLTGFIAAIELDQIRVDALPAGSLIDYYDRYDPDDDDDVDVDSSPRGWRRLHLEYVNLLLSTVDALPTVILEKLTCIATRYEPEFVGEEAIRLFGAVVSYNYAEEDVNTATAFFEMLIYAVTTRPESQSVGEDAPALMKRWLTVTDPPTNLSRPRMRLWVRQLHGGSRHE